MEMQDSGGNGEAMHVRDKFGCTTQGVSTLIHYQTITTMSPVTICHHKAVTNITDYIPYLCIYIPVTYL